MNGALLKAKRLLNWRNIWAVILLIRVPLFILAPGSLFIDGMDRHLGDIDKVIRLQFDFWYPPLYSVLMAIPRALLSPELAIWAFKLFSLICFVLTVKASIRVLRKFEFSETKIKLTILIFALLSWPLLMSVTFISDMFFAYLFILLVQHSLDFDASKKSIAQVAIIYLALLATKPMAIFILPSFLLFSWLRHSRILFLKYLAAIIIGFALFSPWLAKNYVQTGQFYQTSDSSENANTLKFIPLAELPIQAERTFSYFWEFPGIEKLNNFSGNVKTLAVAYYALNLSAFLLFTIIIIVSAVKGIRSPITKQIIALLICCLGFSTVYWPFFGKYDYWDSGRYSLPVLMLLIVFYVSAYMASKRTLLTLLTLVILTFSVINSYIIGLTYYRLDANIQELILLAKDNPTKQVITNDIYTRVTFSYYLPGRLRYDPELPACISQTKVGQFDICLTEDSLTLYRANPSRTVG
jgi:hypothetical protein